MNKKKLIALALASVMCIAAFAGCTSKENTGGVSGLDEITTTDTYPQKTDVTLRYWMTLQGGVMQSATNFGETELAKNLEEATGIKVVYEHPVSGQESTAFNIMLNSKDMPDMIDWQWTTYPGGPDKAIEEGVITPLNDYFEKVSPNVKKLLDENESWKMNSMTDAGYYYQYPMFKENDKLLTYISYFIRKDLLDKAGLPVPTTLEEWEEALYAFRDMGVEVPLSVRINNEMLGLMGPFMGCFGIMGDFYHDGDTVKYGPYEKAFGDYIKLLNKWYEDGILDKNFSDTDSKRRSALVSNGRNGAIEGSVGGDMGRWLTAILPESGIEYVPVTVPVAKEGDTPMWTQATWDVINSTAISGDSKHKELAARFLDFGYSKEGYLLYNFGKENETFTFENVDGRQVPTYMDWMRDTTKTGGLSFNDCASRYIRANSGGPFVQSADYIDQYYSNKVQKDAQSMWSSDVLEYKMPIVYLTEDEQKRYTDIITPINTYREETVAKLISGKMPMEELDNYFAQLKKLGIEEAIEIQQAAYDRTAARK